MIDSTGFFEGVFFVPSVVDLYKLFLAFYFYPPYHLPVYVFYRCMVEDKEMTNVINVDITYFCNYHCEYCYQGIKKCQKHISDTVYENIFKFLSTLKETFTVHLIGGEPYLYPRFFEMSERVVKMGHNVSLTTNFSTPQNIIEKFLAVTDGHLTAYEISILLTQIKDMEEFYSKLEWLKSRIEYSKIKIFCVATNDNFEKVRQIKSRVKNLGLKLTIQRMFDDNDEYAEYNREIEKYFLEEKADDDGIDVPLSFIKSKNKFNVYGKACHTGTKFFKVLIDGEVMRCFNPQFCPYSQLGDFSKSDKVNILPDNTPCMTANGKCKCYVGFGRRGQKVPKFRFFTCKLNVILRRILRIFYNNRDKYVRIVFLKFKKRFQ
jgi:MoaA/NifB/PqqE/SkfB family radical SAM enzyme